MGSSAIRPIILGRTGPQGPKGSKGPTGPTGTGSGLTGPTGETGNYIFQIERTPTAINLTATDGNLQIVGFRGATGYTGTIQGGNTGTGLTLYSSSNGFTLSVKGLSFTGNLSAEVTENSILITPADVYYSTTLSAGITTNRVLFSETETTINSTRIIYGKTYSDFSFADISGITKNSIHTFVEIQGNIINVPSGSNDLILGVTNGAVYTINTPIGLSAFSLLGGTYNNNELISFTLFVHGGGFSQFPSNVYFEDTPYSSYFGCGTNIVNVMTNDMGKNWYATIVDRGFEVSLCNNFNGIGSCCYKEGNTLICNEYVTNEWCQEKAGTFNLFTACSSTCGVTAICCSNGICVEGVSKQECDYFNGKYYQGITCKGPAPSPSTPNTVRQCYNPNLSPTSCCTGGQCIPDVTYSICLDYYKGVPFTGTCYGLNCNANPPRRIFGACCIESERTCTESTIEGCSAAGGVFYGDGITCGEVNCCFTEATGACCLYDGTCVFPVTEFQCSELKGSFLEGQTCMEDTCPVFYADIDRGLCCGYTGQWTNVTKPECLEKDPGAYFYPNPIIGSRAHTIYQWKEAGKYYLPNGQEYGVTGGDCDFCNVARKVALIYIKSLEPAEIGLANGGMELVCTVNRPYENPLSRPWWLYTEGIDNIIYDINQFTFRTNLSDSPSETEADIGYWYRLGNSGLTFDKNMKTYSCCGLVERLPAGGFNDEIRYCVYDPFVMGHIFDAKYADDLGSFNQFALLPDYPTQQQIREFIFGKYLTNTSHVLADLRLKICRGKCNQIPLKGELPVQINCGCFGETTCGYNISKNITPCQAISILTRFYFNQEESAPQCSCSGATDCLAEPPSEGAPAIPEFWKSSYCGAFIIGQQLTQQLDNNFTDPCDVSCQNTILGNRCINPIPVCDCSTTSCREPAETNPCLNLEDCT